MTDIYAYWREKLANPEYNEREPAASIHDLKSAVDRALEAGNNKKQIVKAVIDAVKERQN